MKKYFSKIVCSLVLVAIVAMPFSVFPTKKAESASLTGYIQDLSPLIQKMPGCTKILGDGSIKDLWKGIKSIFKSKEERLAKKATKKGLKTVQEQADFIDTSIPSFDKITSENLETTIEKLGKIEEQNKQINTAVTSTNKNQSCLNDIGKAVVKLLINKFTQSIVDWIKTGYEGAPMFVQDCCSKDGFFANIAKEQILGFGIEINDSEKYPFGKQFMQSTVRGFNSTFKKNAEYSLNKIIKETTPQFSATSFSTDFSQGGWGAWNALTQYPQNNPLGFQIIASSELQKKLKDTQTSVASQMKEDLRNANGWLAQKKCADPKGLTKEEDLAGQTERANTPLGPYQNDICLRWETVTPGAMVGNELSEAMKLNKNTFVSAQTLNDAVAAILDAVLAQFSAELTEKGFADTTNGNSIYDDLLASYEDDGISSGADSSQTEKDYSEYQRDASGWLRTHPDFNIRTDLTQAVIDEQRIYVEKLQEQNKNLYSTTDGKAYAKSDDNPPLNTEPYGWGKTNAQGLIPTINQLDYCIPGPHPGWDDDAQEKIDELVNTARKIIPKDITNNFWWDLFDTLTFNVGPTIVNLVNTTFVECDADTGAASLQLALYTITANFTGLLGGDEIIAHNSDNLCTVDGFSDVLTGILEQYVSLIEKHYNINTLPLVAKEAWNVYDELAGYKQMMKDNDGAIAYQTSIIKSLENVKTEVDKLNAKLVISPINQETYETFEKELKPFVNTFARLSAKMVSGDDIAQVDDLNKQIIDETKYILENLIQGPNGCEADLLAGQNSTTQLMYWDKNNDWMDYFNVRPQYPEPILYTSSYATKVTNPNPEHPDYGKVGNYEYLFQTIHGWPQEIYENGSRTGWWPYAFLSATGYLDLCKKGTGWRGLSMTTLPGEPPKTWGDVWSDMIYLTAPNVDGKCNGNLLNMSGDYVGGNTTYLEKMLQIY